MILLIFHIIKNNFTIVDIETQWYLVLKIYIKHKYREKGKLTERQTDR